MSRPDRRDGFTYDENALRQKFAHALIATNIKGVYAIPAPPDDFDPNAASAEDLVKNGIHWRRPAAGSDPALLKVWRRFFSRKWLAKDRIVPQLAPQIGKTHVLGPVRRKDDGSFLATTWAGAGFIGGSWSGVVGTWTIPTVTEPSEPQGTEGGWNSSSWIGLDGFNFNIVSNDVLQAGIQQKVDAKGQASYVAWFEWFAPPQAGSPSYIYQTNFQNFPVAAGHTVFCLVVLFPNLGFGVAGGFLVLANETTGKTAAVLLLAPPGATAQGNTVEWIMEAPDGGEPTSSIPKFTPVEFNPAVASNYNDTIIGNPEDADTVNLETAGGEVLTSVTVANESVTIDFIG
jgi:hypothetical protein